MEISPELQKLLDQKSLLKDKYGLFGGGQTVDDQHIAVNRKLKALGWGTQYEPEEKPRL
jgi:hypothetical protein